MIPLEQPKKYELHFLRNNRIVNKSRRERLFLELFYALQVHDSISFFR